jgi:hypothetical protein
MTLTNTDIIKRIDKLTLLMLQTRPEYTCEWEIIVVEKIKKLFEQGLLSGGKHLQVLNKLYKDYKGRKELSSGDDRDILNHRKWDLLFSEDTQDELMYKLRYNYLYDDAIVPKDELHNDRLTIQQIKKDLKELSIEFNHDTDIMRIRINKKPGDLVMVENPFDDEHSFPAVVVSSNLETTEQHHKSTNLETVALRCMVDWYKQNDNSVTGSSTLTEYDINTNGTLFAESVTNLA